MYTYRYSVFYISPYTYEESNIESMSEFLRAYSTQILRFASNDQFKNEDEAIECAEVAYKELKANDIIAVYDWVDRRWIKYWTKQSVWN